MIKKPGEEPVKKVPKLRTDIDIRIIEAYNELKKETPGISTVPILKIIERSGLTKKQVHDFIRRRDDVKISGKIEAIGQVTSPEEIAVAYDGRTMMRMAEQKNLLFKLKTEQEVLNERTKSAIDKISQKGQIGEIKEGPGYPIKPTKSVPEFKFKNEKYETGYKRSKGVERNIFQSIKQTLTSLKNKVTREYEHLPKKGKFAEARFALLRLGKQKGVASDKTLRTIQGITIELGDKAYDLFVRKIITLDLYEMAKENKQVPYGLDRNILKVELDNINSFIENNKLEQVNRAVESRIQLWDAIKDDYINAMRDIGFDVADKLTRKNYFRHQILEYVNIKGLYGTGKKLKTPVGRSYLKKRVGSELDINTDYLQAEYEVMAQMLYDIEVANTIKRIDTNYNIIEALRKDAKRIRQETGNDTTWKDLIPEGYESWQPRQGNVFYMADSIPAKLAEELTSGALKSIEITKEDLRKVLAMGGKHRRFVIPSELAATLDNLTTIRSENVIATAHKKIIRGWKVWQLISPRRILKYNIRNLTGDADAAFAGNPAVFKKVPQASKELIDVFLDNKPMTPSMADWFERGGMQSTLQAQEMGELNKLRMFMRLQEKKTKAISIPLTAWQQYWKTARLSTDFRESILRYSAYLRYLDEMKKSPNGMPKEFGASNPSEISMLKDIRDRAYWLSNDLLGAYDRVSVFGQALREHLFPFWSWKEVNFKRYARMFSNAAQDKNLMRTLGRKTIGNTVIRTPYRAYRIAKWGLRASAFLTMLHVWNKTRFPEEEKELPRNVREVPHIILGRNEKGEIEYFSRIGAVGDLLEWFGLDQAPQYTRDILNGRMTIKEAMQEMAKQPVNVVIQGGEPIIKFGTEILTRRSLFPDVFKPGVVRDRMLHFARALGLENEYIALADKPSRGYKESMLGFFAYKVDPLEAAYRDIYREKIDFLKKKGWHNHGCNIRKNCYSSW